MEMVAEEGCSGRMMSNDRGEASVGATPVDLERPQDDTPAELYKHFSIRGYVSLVGQKNPKFCSLPHIFHGQQQYDECPNSLYPFPVRKFRPWDCLGCSDKPEILDHRTTSRTVSMRQNGTSGGCSISLVGSGLVPTSVDLQGGALEVLVVDNPKSLSGQQKCDQARKSGPSEITAPKRSARSNCKKKSGKPTSVTGVLNVKNGRRKQRKMRLLSEIMNTDQVACSRSDTEVDREDVAGLCEGDRRPDDGTPVDIDVDQPVGHILTKNVKNKAKCKGFDVVDEGSSLMNWMKKKKSRTQRFARSNLDRVAWKDVQSNFVSATNSQQGDEILQNKSLETNVQNTYDINKNVKATSLSEIPLTANAENGDVDTENIAEKRVVLKTNDQCLVKCSRVQQHLAKIKRGIHITSFLEHQKRKKQKLEAVHKKQAAIEDIPMDINVELLARNQGEGLSISETGCSDSSPTRISEDEDCTIIAAEDGQNYASTVPSSTSQQKPLTSQSNQKALQDQVASITQVSSTHQMELQMAGNLNPTQEQRSMGKVAASSPLLSQDKDQSTVQPPADRSSHERANTLMWDSFNAAPRDSVSTYGARFRSRIEAVNVASTHVAGACSGHPTHQQVFPTVDYYTNRAVNQVHARSTISTMEEPGNLHDRTNGGQPGFYSQETMHALSPSRLAVFPNYEGSQMEFPLRNQCYAHNQDRGSASTSHGSNINGYLYRGSASTSHERNLNGNQYRGSAGTSHGSNRNEKVPLTLEDLSRHRLQPNLHRELQTLRPLRPLPRVGVLSSLLQKEIENLPDNHGAQSSLIIGESKGITSLDINQNPSDITVITDDNVYVRDDLIFRRQH